MKAIKINKNVNAIKFANQIASILFERINKIATSNNGHYDPTAFDLYNLAFACEMYIKVILSENDILFSKSHNLETLYKLLPEEIKISIKHRYETILIGKIKQPSFDLAIKKSANSFIKFRYIYENIDDYYGDYTDVVSFLIYFTKVLSDYIRKEYQI